MSAMTFAHVTMAKAALTGAKDAHRQGQKALAAQLAASATIHADLCRRLALPTSKVDMSDVEAAEDAAGLAQQYGPGEFGGKASGRSSRSLTPGASIALARSTLERLHQKGLDRPARGGTFSGTRSLCNSRW